MEGSPDGYYTPFFANLKTISTAGVNILKPVTA